MASSLIFMESYGASSGADNAHISLLAADIASGSDDTTVANANPIVVGGSYAYSYERWIRGHWSGTFTTISSVYFWKQSGTLTGSIKIKAKVKTPNPTTYIQPIVTASTYAGASGNEGTTTNDIPTATGTLNPTFNAGSTGTPATTNCSDYIIMQLVVPTGSASGNTACTWRFGWNEV